jgi:signal transduction histidine kinase
MIRYVIALSLIGIVAIGAYLSINSSISKEKKSAAIINISGRQRMYSQRIALYVNLSNNSENPASKDAYKVIIGELADSMKVAHNFLMNGDKKSPAMRNNLIDSIYYAAPHNLDQKVNLFLKEVDLFLNTSDSLEVKTTVTIINNFASEPLLNSINEAVFAYQLESNKIVHQLQNRLTLAVVLILVLIILEGLFIFYPLVQLIQKNEKDLTRQNKQLINLNHDLEQFIYAASHDLKTPIRGLSTLIEFMEQDFSEDLSIKSEEYLNLIKKRVSLSYALIDGLMRYGAISRERHIQTNYDLDIFITRLITETEKKHSHVKITIENKFPNFKTNPVWINEIFSNLIDNAIKYNDKETCIIQLGYKDSDDFHTFCIKDNGKGVDKKYHDKIFKLFQTLKNKEESPTAGIGLAIVKKIIMELGGNVWIDSEANQFFTIYFNIPKKDMNLD